MFISAHHKLYNWNRYRPFIFKLSMSIAISSCWIVINYQKPIEEAVYTIPDGPIDEVFIVQSPRTFTDPKPKEVKPPAKKKPPTTLIIPVDNLDELVSKEEVFEAVVSDTLVNDLAIDTLVEASAPAPIVELVEVVEEEETLVFADQMPVFGDCDPFNMSKEESKKCSDLSILKYIHTRLKYPAIAREENIQGTVVLRFVVDKNGIVKDVKTLRDIGGGCGIAATEIIENMPQWIPGKQNGRHRNVQFTIPIKFDLK